EQRCDIAAVAPAIRHDPSGDLGAAVGAAAAAVVLALQGPLDARSPVPEGDAQTLGIQRPAERAADEQLLEARMNRVEHDAARAVERHVAPEDAGAAAVDCVGFDQFAPVAVRVRDLDLAPGGTDEGGLGRL